MKPHIEKIAEKREFSWKVKRFKSEKPLTEVMCAWHYHKEYELVIYRDPKASFGGYYLAGDAIGDIKHNTMLLYGPAIPHTLSSTNISEDNPAHLETMILWFSQEWFEQLLFAAPELSSLSGLLEQSRYGLHFSQEVADEVYNTLLQLHQRSRPEQFISLIEVLTKLLNDNKKTKVSNQAYFNASPIHDANLHSKVDIALNYIEENYQHPIRVEHLSRVLHMSESSVYRLFEKHFLHSFSEHLNAYRIGKACELLIKTKQPISLVAENVGFSNLSNFNRQFKADKGITPSAYRKRFI